MKINKILIIFVCFSCLFLMLPYVCAINASSSNYSVGRFSSGVVNADTLSNNYQALSLSESAGTTRNAQSDTYTSNVGYFDNTPYYRTVSITSYSPYPRSSQVVSSIRLYISALNYQSVWANITRPDSVVERIELTNNDYVYYTAGIVGRYNITFYAQSSSGAISSVIDYFDVNEVVTPVNHPSGGGGSTGTPSCTYLWDCTPWGVCSQGKQTRECNNIGTCTGISSKPITQMPCSEALFDISIKLEDVNLIFSKYLVFGVNLTEQMGVESIDVHIKYAIIDSSNTEIFGQTETKEVKGNLYYEKEIREIELPVGEYTLRVDVLYGNLQRAYAEQKFEVSENQENNVTSKEPTTDLPKKFNYKIILFPALIIGGLIFILFIIFLIIKMHKRNTAEKSIIKKLKLISQGRIDELEY